ncbi:hypothetical protein BCV69DRAFT_299299 [Microstroma glucosiphilum]|uniref:Uncharacterized protein n=1 Tax=Pseudomicrostroma glucosiphilum TaxID=1684307 RepID=A0A316U6D7_9BASI|nr:hypothetical protein BCV69DRAFT_299299 [Pseudomicrostroma glucosiphilum]PWN20827.1 hypothetical protein BCV69DRAFT_299299 [Pseudomicrostroma glucosiphilum]
MRSFSFSLLSLTCLVLIQLLCSPFPQVQGKVVLPPAPSPSHTNDSSVPLATVAPSQAFVEKRRRKEARKEAKRYAASVAAGRVARAPIAAAVPELAAPVAGRRRAQPLGKRDSNPDIIKARDGLAPLQHLSRQQQQQQKKKRACTTSEKKKKRALKKEKRAVKAKAKGKRAAAAEESEERRYAPDPADHPLN